MSFLDPLEGGKGPPLTVALQSQMNFFFGVVWGTATRYPYPRKVFANVCTQTNLPTRGWCTMLLYVRGDFAKGFSRFCVSFILQNTCSMHEKHGLRKMPSQRNTVDSTRNGYASLRAS